MYIHINSPRDDEEGTEVLNVWVTSRDEKRETDDGDDAEEDHVRTTFPRPVCEDSTSDGGEATDDVGRNTHELRLVVCVSHVLDDRWEEEGD